jgi:hypothetical protein
MVSPQWDERDEAQEALRTIVSDPAYGVAALSSAQMMANLLKDLLPDAPREVSVLVAAAEAGVAGQLRDRVSQGLDVGTASAVVAGSFAASTPFRPDACSWAVSEIAGALGLSSPAPAAPPGSGIPPPGSSIPPGSSVQGSSQPTISVPLGAAGPRVAPGGYPPAAGPGSYPPAGAGGYPPAPGAGGYPAGAVPSAYPPGVAPGGYPAGGQVAPPNPYPAAPAPLGNTPGGYPAASGYPSPPVPGSWPQPSRSGSVPVARTNGLAIASLVLGILWLFWFGSVVSLVLGLVALKQIKTRHQGGRGIAIAGIVLSVLWLLILIVTIIADVAKGS